MLPTLNNPDQVPPGPGPAKDTDINLDDGRFAFTPVELSEMFSRKDIGMFRRIGGLRGLERGLRTNIQTGLCPEEAFSRDSRVLCEETESVVNAKGEDISHKDLDSELPAQKEHAMQLVIAGKPLPSIPYPPWRSLRDHGVGCGERSVLLR
ncbi:hypothetical protein BDV19DRAFT_385585 [Aspergillus venezuelensis]